MLSVENVPDTFQILTIGDSFSQQGKRGYQQFIGNKLGYNITNLQRGSNSPEQKFINILITNQIDSGSIVVIESVERAFVNRLAYLQLSNQQVSNITPKQNEDITKNNNYPRARGFRALSRWIRLTLGYQNPTRHFNLSKSCFSNINYSNELYIYDSPWDKDGDLHFQYLENDIKHKALENLLKLKQVADDYYIQLIYVVAANKYDVYSPWITNNPYPMDETMQIFADLDTTWFVDTKRLLQSHVEAGVKDVYYVNDTHWSPVGAKIVGEHIAKMLANDLDSLGIVHSILRNNAVK